MCPPCVPCAKKVRLPVNVGKEGKPKFDRQKTSLSLVHLCCTLDARAPPCPPPASCLGSVASPTLCRVWWTPTAQLVGPQPPCWVRHLDQAGAGCGAGLPISTVVHSWDCENTMMPSLNSQDARGNMYSYSPLAPAVQAAKVPAAAMPQAQAARNLGCLIHAQYPHWGATCLYFRLRPVLQAEVCTSN